MSWQGVRAITGVNSLTKEARLEEGSQRGDASDGGENTVVFGGPADDNRGSSTADLSGCSQVRKRRIAAKAKSAASGSASRRRQAMAAVTNHAGRTRRPHRARRTEHAELALDCYQ